MKLITAEDICAVWDCLLFSGETVDIALKGLASDVRAGVAEELARGGDLELRFRRDPARVEIVLIKASGELEQLATHVELKLATQH